MFLKEGCFSEICQDFQMTVGSANILKIIYTSGYIAKFPAQTRLRQSMPCGERYDVVCSGNLLF